MHKPSCLIIVLILLNCSQSKNDNKNSLPIDIDSKKNPLDEDQEQQSNRNSKGELKAFPGAEGFGAYAKGGRGGKVMFVNNLQDSGPGSFRSCAEAEEPRMCIFKVAGTITLNDQIKIKSPYITIAGQTAPGSGISICSAATYDKGSLKIVTHDVVIRGLRVRTGASDSATSMRSAIRMEEAAHNIIIDRSSISWATDDNITLIDGVRDVSVQNSIISEALSNSTHSEGEHSKGFAVSGKKYNSDLETGNISVHRNLFAHNADRNLRQASFGVVDFVNNVIYNWGIVATEANDAQTKVPLNVVGNYYKAGKSTKNSSFEVEIDADNGFGAAVYVAGNIGPHRNEQNLDQKLVVDADQHQYLIATSHPSSPLTIIDAELAYSRVLEKAGASPRDAVDQRIINDVKNGSGEIIDDPSEVGGWPDLLGVDNLTDSDQDGMPDVWETENGLDPKKDDGSLDADKNGYSNIEDYINSLL
ncbi:MAG: hypothetical protein KBD78_04265 [Oligoflexales bacterium]|nr:hypothetical protein [Oligoflexales bacterium]